jgi:L-2-hydroxyglutarate oxidase
MEELERRGRQNGLEGIRRLDADQLREIEPHVAGIAGLHVPETGIVDYPAVTRTYARLVQEAGHDVFTGAPLRRLVRESDRLILETPQGPVSARHLINCAGLQSDRVAHRCGVNPGLQIVPFRGEYYEIVPERHSLVRNLIYPVPDPRFPFLGVHFTRMVHGGIEAGPNAVLALRREGYGRFSFSLRDTLRFVFYRGFWRMAWRYWRTGFGELWRSFSKRAFVKALRQLLPELTTRDVRRGGAGVRAQALEPSGQLADDFRIVEAERQVHVLNAPSPAATASLAIGEEIARLARKSFDLK